MRRSLAVVVLAVVIGALLGGTVFRDEIAQARALAQSVVVSNTPAQAVPLREQNLDAQGNIKVRASVTPITDGGGGVLLAGTPSSQLYASPPTATALSIRLSPGIFFLQFTYQGNEVATFSGPAQDGNAAIVLALTRPISFDRITCSGSSSSERCTVGWIGAEP